MRINEYNSLEEFMSQYTGVWNPSDGHWLGIDFLYHGQEYRMQTYAMYQKTERILPDGRPAIYAVYKKLNIPVNEREYEMIADFATMEELIENCYIDGKKFKEVIMADETEILGQD